MEQDLGPGIAPPSALYAALDIPKCRSSARVDLCDGAIRVRYVEEALLRVASATPIKSEIPAARHIDVRVLLDPIPAKEVKHAGVVVPHAYASDRMKPRRPRLDSGDPVVDHHQAELHARYSGVRAAGVDVACSSCDTPVRGPAGLAECHSDPNSADPPGGDQSRAPGSFGRCYSGTGVGTGLRRKEHAGTGQRSSEDGSPGPEPDHQVNCVYVWITDALPFLQVTLPLNCVLMPLRFSAQR